MAKKAKIPGIYVNEIVKPVPAVASVETAIPAFIGYTEKAEKDGEPLLLQPTRITSMTDFQEAFGGKCQIMNISIVLDNSSNHRVQDITIPNTQNYLMYDSLRLFFDNGGGDCIIVSVGLYGSAPSYGDETDPSATGLRNGVKALETHEGPTLLLFPDAVNVGNNGSDDAGFYHLQQMALQQCGMLRDRMCILDLKENVAGDHAQKIENFRNNIGTSYLEFGAAYSPFLISSYSNEIDLSTFKDNIYNSAGEPVSLQELSTSMAESNLINTYVEAADEVSKRAAQAKISREHGAISNILREIKKKICTLPPSGAIAGVYAFVDRSRGVWKAPANVSLNSVTGLVYPINQWEQDDMNVHSSGKSINAIRFFTGKGLLVWGARTLKGDSHEWRYINVRRLSNMIEISVKNALSGFKREPNVKQTWVTIRTMIEDYLTTLWREGAMAGIRPQEAFFVRVGLKETMTSYDIARGRIIVKIGLAPSRPAEFIILEISQQQQSS